MKPDYTLKIDGVDDVIINSIVSAKPYSIISVKMILETVYKSTITDTATILVNFGKSDLYKRMVFMYDAIDSKYKLHNMHGPALVYADGRSKFFINDWHLDLDLFLESSLALTEIDKIKLKLKYG